MELLLPESLLMMFVFASYLCIESVHVEPIAVQVHRSLFGKLAVDRGREGWWAKLACVDWPSHLQPVLAEGLNKQPVDNIIEKIKLMGFNCVSWFTWPVELAINETLNQLTMKESFTGLRLAPQALANIEARNPWASNLILGCFPIGYMK
ncbi:hypothetical protein CDL15_Pgr009786 [Punica granatum]|uniref:Uncharacterized protein n=1 Tax=Punica granatum TaxID=22663 RepID=A0A218WUV4_PUNGR|nr:hypothetical protein CDL15_Pgr009786 [Punica granatum]PKI77101.1 hypothetical protein CRG98_002604 [Punica granatum]